MNPTLLSHVDQAFQSVLEAIQGESEQRWVVMTWHRPSADIWYRSLNRIQQLDQIIVTWESTINDLVRKAKSHISGVKRTRNAALLLHQLPGELLEKVFDLSVYGRQNVLVGLKELSSVCKSWKDLIDGTPSLWSHISSTDHPRAIREAITKSQGHALSIYYTDNSMKPYGFGVYRIWKLKAFLDLVLISSERWKIAHFQISEKDWPDIYPLTSIHTPVLEDLQIRVGQEYVEGSVELSPFPNAPQLRILSLFNTEVDWTSPIFSSTVMELHVVGCIPWIEELVGILRGNLSFSKLEIRGSLPPEAMVIPSDLRNISLDHLESLAVGGADTNPMTELLPYLDMPKCRSFICRLGEIGAGVRLPTFVQQIFLHVAQNLPRLPNQVPKLVLGLRRNFVAFGLGTVVNEAYQQSYCIKLESSYSIHHRHLELSIEAMSRMVPGLAIAVEVENRGLALGETIRRPLNLLQSAPVTELRLFSDIRGGGMRWLTSGSLSDGKYGMPFHTSLEKLTLGPGCSAERVTAMLSSRYDSKAHPSPPKPLQKLELFMRSLPPDLLEEIKRVVGEDRVAWRPGEWKTQVVWPEEI